MDFSHDEFDDPALRDAIRRAVGKPSAPPRLRESVAALLASGPAVPAARPARSRWSIPQITPKLVGLAACVLLSLSFAGYELYEFFGDMYPNAPIPAQMLSAGMTSSMIASHNALMKKTDHQPVATVNFASIRTKLTKEAGFAAFASPLGNGWEFKSADLTTIDGKNAAQVLFVRNDEAASVFSFPVSASACSTGTHICQTVDKHPFAATTQGNVMYAVEVTSTDPAHPPANADAEAILSTVSQAVASAATAPSPTER